jgi:hypothetical protein
MLQALRDAPSSSCVRTPVKLLVGDTCREVGARTIGGVYLIEEVLEVGWEHRHIGMRPLHP